MTTMFRLLKLFCLLGAATLLVYGFGWMKIASALADEILNNDLEGKICALHGSFGSPEIVIGGDSRAYFQLIPTAIESKTGSPTLNVAVNSGELITFVNALSRHPELIAKTKLIVVSVGIYQINDGAIDFGYISKAAFVNLSIFEHWHMYRFRLGELALMYQEVFRIYRQREWKNKRFECTDYWAAGYDLYATKGFLITKEIWGQKMDQDPLLINSWFKDLRLHGPRSRQFFKAVESMQSFGIPVVLYQAPYSEKWKKSPIAAGAVSAELEFGRMLKEHIQKLNNVYFFDFFTSNNHLLSDSNYLNGSHLNETGAKIFTGMFLEKLVQSRIFPAL